MTTQLEFISGLGRRFLGGFKSVNNGELINIISNSGDLTTVIGYIKQVLFNSSRYSPVYINHTYQLQNTTPVNNPIRITTGFGIFWIVCFVIILVFLISAISYHCHKEKVQTKINNERVIKVNKQKKIAKKIWKKIIIPLVVVGFTLWIVSLCFWCFVQSVTNSKFSRNNSTQSSSKPYGKLGNAIELSFIYIANMYNVLATDSMKFITNSVANITTGLTNQISNSISEFAETVLQQLQVTNVFNGANKLINGLGVLITSMEYIYKNHKTTIGSINVVKGTIAVHQNDIQEHLQKICGQLPDKLETTCLNLQTTNSQFRTLIDTSNINTDTSVIMLFLLQQYQINITTITQNYQKVSSQFNSNLNSTFQSAINSVNVASYLNFFSTMWNSTLIPMITPFFNLIFSYKKDSSSIIDNASTYENILMILLIIIIFLLIFLCLVSFYQEVVNNMPWNKYANLIVYIFLVLFSFISALVAIVLIIMTTYLSDQVCHQFNTSEGIQLSDQMVNDKLTLPWKQFSTDISKNVKSFSINLMQPMNIISGINTRCRNSSIGLFTVMEMRNFVNISQILQASGIQNTLVEMRNKSYTAFLSVNPNQVVPNDIVSFINQTKSITIVFDSVDYTNSTNQLSIPLLGIENFANYFQSLNVFVQDANQVLGSNNDLISLSNTVNQLIQKTSYFTEIQSQVKTLKEHFLNLQLYRNNSQIMNQLSMDINTVNRLFTNRNNIQTIFNSNFNRIILVNMVSTINKILNDDFTSITNQIAPCENLSLLWEAIITTMCSSNNLLDTLASLGLLIIMVIVMCQVLLLLVVFSTLIRIQFPKNHSKC